MAVFEELGRGDAALAFSLSMHNAVDGGGVSVRATTSSASGGGGGWPRGEALGGFSLTEPHAGSDATTITTRATSTTGRLARDRAQGVGVARRRGGPVPGRVQDRATSPGTATSRWSPSNARRRASPSRAIYRKACADFLPIGEMVLEDVPGTVLAPPGEGLRAALVAIDVARCDIAAIANGLHAEAARRRAPVRPGPAVFGSAVIDHQGIQWALADAETDLVAGRLLTRRAAERLGTPEGTVAVAHAKRFCPDAALRAAILASEVLGAYGWLEDHPFNRAIALAKMLQVVDGTTEIQRVVIARDLLKRAESL